MSRNHKIINKKMEDKTDPFKGLVCFTSIQLWFVRT